MSPITTRSTARFRELWDFRELFYVLARRDLGVRYKQTVLGALWSLIQLFFTMVVFTLVFGRCPTFRARACRGRSSTSPRCVEDDGELNAFGRFAWQRALAGQSRLRGFRLISG